MIDNKPVPVITIDGPSGTGKGTLCHMLAKELSWHFLDSGSLYRVLACTAKQKAIALQDINQLVLIAQTLNVRFEDYKVILDDLDATEAIRTEQCGQDASVIAVIPEIREALLARQRAFAVLPGLVTDGRDMGTVVFPDAILKIYLYANEKERAKRRYLQLKEKGINVSLQQVIYELEKRDLRDIQRAHSPLKPAEDAFCIDTTELEIVQVLQNVLELVDKYIFKSEPRP